MCLMGRRPDLHGGDGTAIGSAIIQEHPIDEGCYYYCCCYCCVRAGEFLWPRCTAVSTFSGIWRVPALAGSLITGAVRRERTSHPTGLGADSASSAHSMCDLGKGWRLISFPLCKMGTIIPTTWGYVNLMRLPQWEAVS